jgi:hypothetical protein
MEDEAMSDTKPGVTTRARARGTRNVRLRPANPFDLIRLIAQSQSDPRKAMAELVQNSLDAAARNLTITRRRRGGEVVVSIFDDGHGVFPDLERPQALERIATNIGHSFKRNLSPAERQHEMMLGKYGIGILGFWSLGRELEMRTRISGSEVWALRLVRDDPFAEVLRIPERRFPFPEETWTEVIIRGIHQVASRPLAGRRLGEYLGSELRGQLLARPVKLRIVDHLARGSALKDFLVVPPRFRGKRIEEIGELQVPGYAPARIELYFVPPEEERHARVALTCGGSVVCDDLAALESYGLDRPPWTLGLLEGFAEFPDLEVVPSTRRGFVPNAAAEALLAALRSLEPRLSALIEERVEKQRQERDEDLARELRKVFRPVARNLPQYDFFAIAREAKAKDLESVESDEGAALGRAGEHPEEGPATPPGEAEPAAGSAASEAPATEVVDEGDEPEPPAEIFPPEALERVRIVPRRSRLLPGATRSFTAKAVDAAGRRLHAGVDFAWSLLEGGGTLQAEGDHAAFKAPEELGRVRLGVTARQGERAAAAEAEVEVVDKLQGESPDAGIPDPQRAYDPQGDWRSRLRGRRWEYNAAHPDYQAVADDPRRRFRYLVHLFAKEIVLWNYGEAKDERLLERMVEVLTHIKPRV